MTDYRKNLIDRMIRLYGFEDEKVIAFVNLCERYANSKEWDNVLQTLVITHEEYPVMDEE